MGDLSKLEEKLDVYIQQIESRTISGDSKGNQGNVATYGAVIVDGKKG